MPPSITKCATWMPWGLSSRAIDCARPRSANLPMAKVEESAKPFTPAVAPVRKIAPCFFGSLLRDQEAAESRDLDGAAHVLRRQVDQRPAHAAARVVDHDVGRAAGIDRLEQAGNVGRIAGVALEDARPGLLGQRRQLVGLARGDRDLQAVPGEQARQGGTEAGAYADDQRRG